MRILALLIVPMLLFGACKTDTSKNVVKLKNGGEYILLKEGNGKKSNPGDYLLFSLLLKDNTGKVLQDRTKEASWINQKINKVDSSTMPLMEMIFSIAEGDSVMYNKVLTEKEKARGMQNVDTLIYVVKAQKIMTEEEMNAKKKAEQEKAKAAEAKIEAIVSGTLDKYKKGKLKKDIKKTDSGVEIYLNEKGNGAKVEKGKNVEVAYYGVLKADGKMFDNSFGRGRDLPFTAGAGQMIKGWDEAMLHLNEGDKATIFIPWKLAYGENGRPPVIPAKSDLVFYLEVNSVK